MKPNESSPKNFPGSRPSPCCDGLPVPSLRVWAAVGFSVLVLVLLSLPYYRQFLKNDPADMPVSRRSLEAFGDTGLAGRKKRVVVIGTSLIHAATYPDNRMEALAGESAHVSLRFLRISRGGGSFSNFSPLIEPILTARPAVLVIQSDLLLDDYNIRNYPTFIRLALRKQRQSGLNTTSPDAATGRLDDHAEHVSGQLNDAECATYARQDANYVPPPSPEIAGIERLLQRAQQCGIKVVVVTVPRSFMAGNLEKNQKTKMAGLAPLLATYRVERLVLTEPLGLENYYHPTHLNARGKDVFSRWFVAELGRILSGGERP